MAKSEPKTKSIKVGDRRILFESTTTSTFSSPNGITYEPGSIIRGSTYVDIAGIRTSLSLPSMAELIFSQAEESLIRASRLKSKALRAEFVNGYARFVDEAVFYEYMQLMSLGILGLYASLETMVFELYIRKKSKNKIMDGDREVTEKEFSSYGFDRKMTSVATILSGKSNIFGTPLFDKANKIKNLRHTLQYWDGLIEDNYFIELPQEHPLKIYPNLDPLELVSITRELLDHYSLSQ